jgi:FKBP-type peptidyl-prolyl cis-trans isomerase (trigger factor)
MSQITVEKTAEDSASKSLRVTVPVDRVREAEAKAVKYYAKRARLPGFRPGKAPDAVVRKRFNDAIRQTVLEEVLREGWETAKTTESLKPIADPSVRNLKFEEGSGSRRAGASCAHRRSGSSTRGAPLRCSPLSAARRGAVRPARGADPPA